MFVEEINSSAISLKQVDYHSYILLPFISKEIITITLLVGIHLQADVFISHKTQEVQPTSHCILIMLGIHQSLKLFVFLTELYHRFTLQIISYREELRSFLSLRHLITAFINNDIIIIIL